ncbi:hypothetical protein HPP92_002947 [Vanilla planifolia]|uniref:Uncharacterized protein n=1 Tax=Vanilla planifolia TaxID=51239 RepID=A0A835S9F9_VANPL|nr:hypothetical protein HPP92_002947 [Vanilla planifolia]
MYGECQVLPSIGSGSGGGNFVSPDSLFSSPTRNPNLGGVSGFIDGVIPFASFSSIVPKEEEAVASQRKEEMESGSGSGHLEGLSCGEEHDDGKPLPAADLSAAPAKKKRYHRHTARQIQEMEALFKECPHPDDKQRLRLSQELGLKPRQVKFWFQNRRTQMKAQQDRVDNVILRADNENLKNENYRLQVAIRNVVCPNCGGPAVLGEVSFDEHNLRIENARLKEELERLSCIVGRFNNRSMHPSSTLLLPPPSLDLEIGMYTRQFQELPQLSPATGVCADMLLAAGIVEDGSTFAGAAITEGKKPLALELAMAAAEQLVRMCRMDEPLWSCGGGEVEVLDEAEHDRLFPWHVDFKSRVAWGSGWRDQGQRAGYCEQRYFGGRIHGCQQVDGIVPLHCVQSKNHSGYNVWNVWDWERFASPELQALSPLVPTREAYFLRYCQQNVDEGTWTIVDFPVDGLQDGIQLSPIQYRRRPSGCVIQDMPNGYSKVIWVEHAEVEDKPVHQIFSQFIGSGMAFGAQRWLSILQRQCERLASLMARNISDLGVIPTLEARKNMMNLSHRMVKSFCASITSSESQSWTALSDMPDDTIRISTRKNTLPGQPNGVILLAVFSTWLPFSYHQVFDLLTDERRRSQLDALSNGNSLHEVAHIANGSHPRNCVSLLRINAGSNSPQNVELLLQESSTHPSAGSLIVYSTIDVDAVQVVMSDEDPSFIPLLPTGFILFPTGPASSSSTSSNTTKNRSSTSGCLLTVGMQVLASAVPSAKLSLSSVTAVNHHLCSTVHQISTTLAGSCRFSDLISFRAWRRGVKSAPDLILESIGEAVNQLHGDLREELVRVLTFFYLFTVVVNVVCPFSCVYCAAPVSGLLYASVVSMISVWGSKLKIAGY